MQLNCFFQGKAEHKVNQRLLWGSLLSLRNIQTLVLSMVSQILLITYHCIILFQVKLGAVVATLKTCRERSLLTTHGLSQLQKFLCPINLRIYAWCPPMMSCSILLWSILRFQATQTLPQMNRAHFHVLFMKGCCVYSSSLKQMFTIGESRSISHANDTQAQQGL